MQFNQKIITAREVVRAIADEKSHELFNIIAAGENCTNLIDGGNMTRKEYYLRLTRLVNLDLIKRVEGRYILTTFGKVIYQVQIRLAVAVNNRWKLKAFDNLYSDNTIPVSERSQVMNQIINDTGNNEIILESFTSKDDDNDKIPLMQA